MKKVLLVLFVILLLNLIPHAYSQASSKSASAEISYTLAYPGMLPDHPLYKLKVLRDKIVLRLISDPKKRVEQYLLQTDKGIAMVPMLVDKGNLALAKETALKAENNFTELTFVYKKYQLKPDSDMLKKLNLAALKHQEVLSDILKKVKGNDQKVMQQVINFSKTNQEELKRILKEKN